MKTINQDDAKLFRKARRRVGISLAAAYLLLCLYFVALYYILNLPVFGKPPELDFPYMISAVAEILAWMLIFMSLASGNPKNRYLMYGGIIMEMLFTVYIFYMGYSALSGQFAYFAWGLISLIKVYCLYCYGTWLKSSFWCRIYFDKIIEVYTPQPPASVQNAPAAASDRTVRAPDFQSQNAQPLPSIQVTHLSRRKQRKLQELMEEEARARLRAQQAAAAQEQAMAQAREAARQEALRQAAIQEQQERRAREIALQKQLEEQRRQAELEAKRAEEARIAEEKKYAAFTGPSTRELMNSIKVRVVNYPLLAVRLGLVVYGELILFPIFTELFRSMFMSADGQYSFATTGIFTLSIISAAIWTIDIFFLYLRQPASRKVILGSLAAEVLINAFYYFVTLRNIMAGDVIYSSHVYTIFTVVDLARYPLILWAIWPIFTLPVPRARTLDLDKDKDTEEDPYEDLFEGESSVEEAPSLKDALSASYDVVKDRTSVIKDKALQAASEVLESARPAEEKQPDVQTQDPPDTESISEEPADELPVQKDPLASDASEPSSPGSRVLAARSVLQSEENIQTDADPENRTGSQDSARISLKRADRNLPES